MRLVSWILLKRGWKPNLAIHLVVMKRTDEGVSCSWKEGVREVQALGLGRGCFRKAHLQVSKWVLSEGLTYKFLHSKPSQDQISSFAVYTMPLNGHYLDPTWKKVVSVKETQEGLGNPDYIGTSAWRPKKMDTFVNSRIPSQSRTFHRPVTHYGLLTRFIWKHTTQT